MFSLYAGAVLCAMFVTLQGASLPPPSPAPRVCPHQDAEVFFLLDSSSSVWIVDYWKMLDFVADLVARLPVESGRMRVGTAVFSSDYHPVLNLTQTWASLDDLQRAIRNLEYQSGNTYTNLALRGMLDKGFVGSRQNAPKIGVLLTDGCSQHALETKAQALRAREQGVSLLVLGIGNQVCRDELLAIASSARNVFQADSFDHLSDHSSALLDRLCQVAASSNKTTATPKCQLSQKTDIMFVFDSACLGTHKVKQVNDFISEVVKEFDIASGKVRSGILSKNVLDNDVQLNKFQDEEGMVKDLKSKEFPELSQLVRKLRLQSYTSPEGGRLDAEKRAVLVIHSELAERGKVQMEVNRAQDLWNIQVYLVVVGNVNHGLTLPAERVVKLPDLEKGQLEARKDTFLKKFC